MCLIAFSFTPGSDRHLLLAANRDEFHARPARPMAWWNGPVEILAGRDEQAGGTWLALARDGRWAAVTNVRDPSADSGRLSRGKLPLGFFEAYSRPEDYARSIQGQRAAFGPFNLLVGDSDSLWYASSHAPASEVGAGVHALSNGLLDAPWPKSRRVAAGLDARQGSRFEADELLRLLDDREKARPDTLPDTGVGLEMEQFLSSPFIASERYGTRCSTVMALGNGGQVAERRFGLAGETLGQLSYRWTR